MLFHATFNGFGLVVRIASLRHREGKALRCVSGLRRNPKPGNAKVRFAKRNESFRSAGRKSLKSLCALNQSFRVIVCFQWVNCLFVSPFSQHSRSRPEIPVDGSQGVSSRLRGGSEFLTRSGHDSGRFSKREEVYLSSDL